MLRFAGTTLGKLRPSYDHSILLIVHEKTKHVVRRFRNLEELLQAT
jgi:hypothetical protein